MGFLDKPRGVWWRRASFQIHLWSGIALALYVLAIGVSGSIIVFNGEIERWYQPPLPSAGSVTTTARVSVDAMKATVEGRFPGRKIYYMRTPVTGRPAYLFVLEGKDRPKGAFLDAEGRIVAESELGVPWLSWLERLHGELLAGESGETANGVGALVLLGSCLTGLIVWWPGVSSWRRALWVDLSKGWRRVTFDLHGAVGLWTLAWLLMWATTTLYFVWPKHVKSVIELATPITGFPEIKVPPPTVGPLPSLESFVTRANQIYPDDRLAGMVFSHDDDDAVMLQMARREVGDFPHTDFLYFDRTTGEHLGTYRRGVAYSLGDRLIWLTHVLHFGNDLGLGIKFLWAFMGLSLPALAVTGLVMYWNRYLSKRWRML
ncbi:MAG: hypothetical protein GC160_12455 [Acidobacteria bacterium]|nr:hypothetical protein [Acidobacteriota bacterium]